MPINPVSTSSALADITPAQIESMKYNLAHECRGLVDSALRGELQLTEHQASKMIQDMSRRASNHLYSVQDPEQREAIIKASSLFGQILRGCVKN